MLVGLIRFGCVIFIASLLINREILQTYIDQVYSEIYDNKFFKSVYFETIWVTMCYAVLVIIPFTMDKFVCFDKYKCEPNIKWQSTTIVQIIIELIQYISPLMVLDTFLVKQYNNVDYSVIKEHKSSWIQKIRPLPLQAPTVTEILVQLLGAFVIYDVLFYVVHRTLHSNHWLYVNIHKVHHEHGSLHTRITNQLHVVERIILILSANQALKIMYAHPLTRAIFVPLFVLWLIDNHSGYSSNISLDKIVPFGLVAGPETHHEHHEKGSQNYQPFFTYIDTIGKRNR